MNGLKKCGWKTLGYTLRKREERREQRAERSEKREERREKREERATIKNITSSTKRNVPARNNDAISDIHQHEQYDGGFGRELIGLLVADLWKLFVVGAIPVSEHALRPRDKRRLQLVGFGDV